MVGNGCDPGGELCVTPESTKPAEHLQKDVLADVFRHLIPQQDPPDHMVDQSLVFGNQKPAGMLVAILYLLYEFLVCHF
jgi:hypothetical protein